MRWIDSIGDVSYFSITATRMIDGFVEIQELIMIFTHLNREQKVDDYVPRLDSNVHKVVD